MVTGHVSVFEDGKALGTHDAGEVVLQQARAGADDRSRHPPRAVPRTCTSSSPDFNASAQTGTYTVTVNPLVNWIWFGFAVMAIGTGIALSARTARSPSRSRRFPEARRRPAGAPDAAAAIGRVRAVAARADGQRGPGARESQLRQADRERHHVHVRVPGADGDCPMGPCCHGLQDAGRQARRADCAQGMTREQIRRRLRRRARRPGHPDGADRHGLQPAGVVVPYAIGDRRRRRRSSLAAKRWSRHECRVRNRTASPPGRRSQVKTR